jgi:hypothetical protein
VRGVERRELRAEGVRPLGFFCVRCFGLGARGDEISEEDGEAPFAGGEAEAGEIGVAADLVEEAEGLEFGIDEPGAEAVVLLGRGEGGAVDEGVAVFGEVVFGGPAERVEGLGGRGVEESAEEGLFGAAALAGGDGGFVGGVGGEGFGSGHGSAG